jgi:hypothetical protein
MYLDDLSTYNRLSRTLPRATKRSFTVHLLESIEHFLKRLDIYTEILPTSALAEVLVVILVELLSTLGPVTKQTTQTRPARESRDSTAT